MIDRLFEEAGGELYELPVVGVPLVRRWTGFEVLLQEWVEHQQGQGGDDDDAELHFYLLDFRCDHGCFDLADKSTNNGGI